MPMENGTEPMPTDDEISPLAHLDEDVRVMDWSYSDGHFRVVFEADAPTRVTVSEATQSVEGVSTFTFKKERLLPGENTVRIAAAESGGEAQISITSPASERAERGLIISTGEVEQASPFERTSSTAGWFGGAGTVAFMMIVVVVRELRREPDAPEVAK